MRWRVAILCAVFFPFSAGGQGVMRIPILCMEGNMFRDMAANERKESALMYSETNGGGYIELWSSDTTYALVYYPKDGALACILSTGKKLIPGPRALGPES